MIKLKREALSKLAYFYLTIIVKVWINILRISQLVNNINNCLLI